MGHRTYHVETLGCRANQADSATLCRQLESREFSCAPAAAADLLIVNTCTVTCHADRDSRYVIRKLRRENPVARLIVTGCYAKRAPAELFQIQGVDYVIGNAGQCLNAGSKADPALAGENHSFLPTDILHTQGPSPNNPQILSERRTRPFIKIQDGCDARCSYCIVPMVRGPARSAPPQEVLQQVRALVDEGHQEIVLTGINLGVYGRRFAVPTTLSSLIEAILRVPGLERLRLSCIEPMRLCRSLINLAAQQEKLAPHFHMPLQSGTARILSLMRRPYRPAQYMRLVEDLRKKLPAAAIGTDVITGFPGETEFEHLESLKFVEESPITHVHVFSYSKRKGTVAGTMEELPAEIVRRRSQEFRKLAALKKASFEKTFIGSRFKALTLQPDREKGQSLALTGNFITVRLPGLVLAANRWVEILLDSVVEGNAIGSLIRIIGPPNGHEV